MIFHCLPLSSLEPLYRSEEISQCWNTQFQVMHRKKIKRYILPFKSLAIICIHPHHRPECSAPSMGFRHLRRGHRLLCRRSCMDMFFLLNSNMMYQTHTETKVGIYKTFLVTTLRVRAQYPTYRVKPQHETLPRRVMACRFGFRSCRLGFIGGSGLQCRGLGRFLWDSCSFDRFFSHPHHLSLK